jgi:hypothetical protein
MSPNAENSTPENRPKGSGSSALGRTPSSSNASSSDAPTDHLTLGERLAREAAAQREANDANPPTGFVSTGPIRSAVDPASGEPTEAQPVVHHVGSSGRDPYAPPASSEGIHGAAAADSPATQSMPQVRRDTRFDDEEPRGLAGISDQGPRPEPAFLKGFDDDEVGEYVPGQWNDEAPETNQQGARRLPDPAPATSAHPVSSSPANTSALPAVSSATGLSGAAAVGAHADQVEAERRKDEDTPFLRRAEPAAAPQETRSPVENEYANRLGILAREKEEFGGLRLGAGFFGWLTATGMTSLFAIVAASILGAVAYTSNLTTTEMTRRVQSFTTGSALTGSQGISAAIVAGLVLFLSFLAGGYVAGRMSRFSGALQGFGVWLWFLAISVAVTVAGIFGVGGLSSTTSAKWLPSTDSLTQPSTLIGLGAVALLTLISAILGGALGMRYHRKIDRFDYAAAYSDEA